MGKKKALVAVGHSILRIVSHVLCRKQGYHELGGNAGDRRSVAVQRQQFTRKLEALGLTETVAERQEAA